MSSYTLKSRSLSHVGVRNGLFYDDHVGIFQLPLETQRVLVFYYLYIYIYYWGFFVKVNATRKHSGLIPNLCGQGGSICDHCSGYTHFQWNDWSPIPPSHPTTQQYWTGSCNTNRLPTSLHWLCLSVVPSAPPLKKVLSSKALAKTSYYPLLGESSSAGKEDPGPRGAILTRVYEGSGCKSQNS